MMGLLTRDLADLTVVPLTMMLDRSKDMDFTVPVTVTLRRLFMKRQAPSVSNWACLLYTSDAADE